MATDNVELVRQGYAAWNRGEVDEIVDAFDEDVEWHGHPRFPEPGPYIGREAVRRWLDDLGGAWEEISVHPLAFAERGDEVVVLVHITGRGRGSGLEVGSGIDAHVWTVRDGRILRMRWIQGDEVARRAELSDREREVLRLRITQDLGDRQIAERLRLPAEEVQSLADAALAKLPLVAGSGSE